MNIISICFFVSENNGASMRPSIDLHNVSNGSDFLLFILEINFEMFDLAGCLIGSFLDHIDMSIIGLHESP